jgi:hypothetical protein
VITEQVRPWREKKKKAGYCQFCWKRRKQEGSTKTLCATCRRYKIAYEEGRRRAAGIKPRGKPLPRKFGVLPYKPRKPIERTSLGFVNSAFEREQIAKLERQEQRRKAVQSAWLREHGYEVRANG